MLHQDEVDLLKTVILFLTSSPTHLHLESQRRLIFSVKWHSVLSKLTSCFVSLAAAFYRLSDRWGARTSVCRLVGGQQEWVLCEGQQTLEFLIEGN